MSKTPELYVWLKQNNYFTKKTENQSATHLLYDGYEGGKIYLPREKEYEFLKRYSMDINNGLKHYVIEQRPRVYKFMMDLDISDTTYWKPDKIEIFVKKIQLIVNDYFPEKYTLVCCTSPPKKKRGSIHTGIHLIWPGVYVNSEDALIIRAGVIQKMNENDEFINKTSWETVFDELIYTRVGYRLTLSDKMTKDDKTGERYPDKRMLTLLWTMNYDGSINDLYTSRLKNDNKSLVLDTSIRYTLDIYFDAVKGMEINIPRWMKGDNLSGIINKISGHNIKGVIVSSDEHYIIEEFIRTNLPIVYKTVKIKAVTRYPDDNILIKTDSRHCLNIGKKHNSCGIYFFASQMGIYQKCLCPCEKLDNRKHGYCRDFTSKCYPFDKETSKKLFPNFNESVFDNISSSKKAKSKKQEAYNPKKSKNKHEDTANKLFNEIMGF